MTKISKISPLYILEIIPNSSNFKRTSLSFPPNLNFKIFLCNFDRNILKYSQTRDETTNLISTYRNNSKRSSQQITTITLSFCNWEWISHHSPTLLPNLVNLKTISISSCKKIATSLEHPCSLRRLLFPLLSFLPSFLSLPLFYSNNNQDNRDQELASVSPGEEEPNLLPCSRHDRPHNAMKKKKSTRPTVERQPRRCKIASHSPIKASFESSLSLSLASAFKSCCSLFLSPLPPSMPRFSFPRRTLTREETILSFPPPPPLQ